MRKLLLTTAVLVGLGLALFFLLRPTDPSSSGGPDRGQASAPRERSSKAPRTTNPHDASARGSTDAGATLALAEPASEADGVLEVEVLAHGQPVPGASVRLYWRGPRDPNLGKLTWRMAGVGATNAQGRARLAAAPGSYLVAVRAPGHAPLLRDVIRPAGEALTALRLTLERGVALTGRTVVKGSQEPLPLVELSLIAHTFPREPWQGAEAPAEEHVYATSDERGDFRVEPLAAGTYLLEARAPGHARTVFSAVKVPAAGPLTVALSMAGVIEGFVVDARGQPAAGAEVQVNGFAPQVATTGAGGGFSVEVEAGDYTLSARRGAEAGALAEPLIISAGRTVRDVRLQLGPGAVLEGRVVATATKAAVEGARVDVSPYGQSGDLGRAVTDAQGRFFVEGLSPGSYDVVVEASGYSTLERRGVTVSSGERFSLELELSGTGAVEGQVLNGQGAPVVGVQISAAIRWDGPMGGAPSESRTDAEGNYRLEGLTVGPLMLTARREGAAAGSTQPVEVKEGETQRLDFTLEETGTLEGVVRAPQGPLPVEPLTAMAIARDDWRIGAGSIGQTAVAADGTFRMELPPGTYEVFAMAEQRGEPPRHSAHVQVEEAKTVKVELLLQDEASGAESLRGVVLEPDGAPSPGAFVTLSHEEEEPGLGGMVITDEQGRFTLPLAPPESGEPERVLRVSARNGGRAGEVRGLRPGEREVVVRLRRAASLSGRVVRASGGVPVRGFTVTVHPQSWGAFQWQEARWEFAGDRFELKDVPAEPLEVQVQLADGARGEAQVSPSPGEAASVEVLVRGMAGVRGRLVEEATGAPLAEGYVSLEGARATGIRQMTASDGRFTLEAVPPGEYSLEASTIGPDMDLTRRPVTLMEGEVLDVGDIAVARLRPPPGSTGVLVGRGEGGLIVRYVSPESPGAQAGVREGDELLALDGVPVENSFEAIMQLQGAPGSVVVLTVRREGVELTLSVTRAQ